MSLPSRQNEQNLAPVYKQMMRRIQCCLASATNTQPPTLQTALNHAQNQAVLLAEASPEQAQQVATYIKQDINEAAEYLMESSQDFSEWLMLDIDELEQKVLRLFFSVANSTQQELNKFNMVIR